MGSKLGQNFLINKDIAKQIVESLDDNDIIIEVGPGKGALTKYLYEKFADHLFLIELDRTFIPNLEEIFPLARIICQDILNIDLRQLANGKKINIIGNLPYCVSTEILFMIHKYRDSVQQIVCMLQKEVVDRVCAKNKCKQYGVPSVLLQSYFNINKLFEVDPDNFLPIPKVFSAVMKMERNSTQALNCDESLFNRIVHQGFQHRRKTLKNALSAIINKEFCNELLSLRAEQLSITDFVILTNEIDSFEKKHLFD